MIETDTIDTLELKIKEAFEQEFSGETPLLIFSPGRINIIGEHTDYNQGFVLPASINLGIVIGINSSSQDQSTVVALDKNEHLHFNPKEDLTPIKKGGWKNYVLGIVIELKKRGVELPCFNIAFGGNVPGGAGLSSSAALENGIVFALNEFFRLELSKQEMILISQRAEQKYVGVHCGIMDQYASMFGKENHVISLDCKTNVAQYVTLNLMGYEFLLINTNVKHELSEGNYNDRRYTCESVVKKLGKSSLREVTIPILNTIKNEITEEEYQMCLYVVEENQRVIECRKALESGDIGKVGKLLFESHKGLKTQYRVSCRELDFLVDEAKKHPDVIGARMMGGGFGGCTVNLIQAGKSDGFLKKVTQNFETAFGKKCTPIQIKITDGTRVIND